MRSPGRLHDGELRAFPIAFLWQGQFQHAVLALSPGYCLVNVVGIRKATVLAETEVFGICADGSS